MEHHIIFLYEGAIGFQEVFVLRNIDPFFLVVCLSQEEWVQGIIECLKSFYDITPRFSYNNYATDNLYFYGICRTM